MARYEKAFRLTLCTYAGMRPDSLKTAVFPLLRCLGRGKTPQRCKRKMRMCMEPSPGAPRTLLHGELRRREKLGPVQPPIRDGSAAPDVFWELC